MMQPSSERVQLGTYIARILLKGGFPVFSDLSRGRGLAAWKGPVLCETAGVNLRLHLQDLRIRIDDTTLVSVPQKTLVIERARRNFRSFFEAKERNKVPVYGIPPFIIWKSGKSLRNRNAREASTALNKQRRFILIQITRILFR